MPHDPSLNWRAGTVTTELLVFSYNVIFEAAFINNNYTVILTSNVEAIVTFSNKTSTGFTANISISIVGKIDYLAIPYN